jgi:formate dehydrogenase major subunit
VEETDVVVLWGSNAREAHPIFFHHVLKTLKRGAKLYVVDPRRTSSAAWAEGWLGLNVGTDIPLANGVAREILVAGLANERFIANATSDFERWKASVMEWTLEKAQAVTGVPAALIAQLAHDYAKAPRAVICWTLGITEHHNATDNVLSLINLGLVTGHVGRWGSGLNPLRGQNNVQGGGDMGALPHKLPGFNDVENDQARARCEAAWGFTVPPKKGWTLTEMFHAMERGELRAVHCLGENPAQSEADSGKTIRLLKGLDFLVVQDLFLTGTAELADVVLPAAAAWCETDGTVTNSERRVQRVRKALSPLPGTKDDLEILFELAHRFGVDLGPRAPQAQWDELRRVSPMHAGMSWARLDELGGIQWPCPDETHGGEPFLHGRLWQEPRGGPPAPFSVVRHSPPVDVLNEEFPLRLTTGRRLDSYNTGVQTRHFASPLRDGEALELHPDDAAKLSLRDGERVRVRSRRGAVETKVRVVPSLSPGLVFMTFHFPDEVDTNALTIDATDPRAGTAEYKAAAVCVEKL